MANESELLALIERLENETGPCRETDLAIHLWLNPDAPILFDAGNKKAKWGKYRDVSIGEWKDISLLMAVVSPPHYTSSIDAALTLLPEGFAIQNFEIWPNSSSLRILETHKEKDGLYWHSSSERMWEAEHGVPSIALCIAAMKARLSLLKESK